jgi:hypothetical protein
MRPDEAYRDRPALAAARHLQRAGRWDLALDLLAGADDAADLRADILCDRHQWRLDDRTEAVAAIDAIRETNGHLATLLGAQLEYWAYLFRKNVMAGADVAADLGDPPGLVADPVEEFHRVTKEADDEGLRDWAAFWYAVSSENLRDDLATARPLYTDVYERATARGELLLASYASRHLGGVALYDDGEVAKGLDLLKLSMYQRHRRSPAAPGRGAGDVCDGPRRRRRRRDTEAEQRPCRRFPRLSPAARPRRSHSRRAGPHLAQVAGV